MGKITTAALILSLITTSTAGISNQQRVQAHIFKAETQPLRHESDLPFDPINTLQQDQRYEIENLINVLIWNSLVGTTTNYSLQAGDNATLGIQITRPRDVTDAYGDGVITVSYTSQGADGQPQRGDFSINFDYRANALPNFKPADAAQFSQFVLGLQDLADGIAESGLDITETLNVDGILPGEQRDMYTESLRITRIDEADGSEVTEIMLFQGELVAQIRHVIEDETEDTNIEWYLGINTTVERLWQDTGYAARGYTNDIDQLASDISSGIPQLVTTMDARYGEGFRVGLPELQSRTFAACDALEEIISGEMGEVVSEMRNYGPDAE